MIAKQSPSDASHEAAADQRPRSGTFAAFFAAASEAAVRAAEIGSHVGTLIEVRTDRARAAAQRAMLVVAIAVLALIALGTIVVSASIRIVSGIAASFSEAFGGRPWIGDLLGGSLVLALIALSTACAWKLWTRARWKRLEAKYAQRRRRHVERFRSEQRTGASAQ
jgi:hypothetical protein